MTLNYEEKKKERKNVMLFRRDLIKTISSVFVRPARSTLCGSSAFCPSFDISPATRVYVPLHGFEIKSSFN